MGSWFSPTPGDTLTNIPGSFSVPNWSWNYLRPDQIISWSKKTSSTPFHQQYLRLCVLRVSSTSTSLFRRSAWRPIVVGSESFLSLITHLKFLHSNLNGGNELSWESCNHCTPLSCSLSSSDSAVPANLQAALAKPPPSSETLSAPLVSLQSWNSCQLWPWACSNVSEKRKTGSHDAHCSPMKGNQGRSNESKTHFYQLTPVDCSRKRPNVSRVETRYPLKQLLSFTSRSFHIAQSPNSFISRVFKFVNTTLSLKHGYEHWVAGIIHIILLPYLPQSSVFEKALSGLLANIHEVQKHSLSMRCPSGQVNPHVVDH